MSSKYSIVIPCYNEEKGLDALINAICNFDNKYDVEFILVENGSKDNSREIFLNRKEFDDIKIKKVLIDVNQGYGYGIKQGLKIASGDFVGWIHADLQLPLEELYQFFEYANDKNNIHIFMKGIRHSRPFVDTFFTKGMGIFETLLFKTYLYDVMAMPIIFHKDLLKYYDKFPNDFSVDIFVYALSKKLKYEIYRKKINQKNREFGDSSWNTGFISRIKQSKKMIDGSLKIRRDLL